MPKDQLAALVIAARKRAGFPTQYAFCKATGISSGTISDIESGKSSPSVKTLGKLMNAIDVDVVVMFRSRKKPRKAKSKPKDSRRC